MKIVFPLFSVIAALLPASCAGKQAEKGTVQTVVFPAYGSGRTENYAEIFDIPPFTMTVELPENWSIGYCKEPPNFSGIGK